MQVTARRLAPAVALAIAVLVFVVWRVQRPAPTAVARSAQPVVSRPVIPPPPPAARVALPPIAVTPNPELGAPGLATDDPLTAFKKQNVYPPTSRPLSTEHVDLLHPNRRHEQPRPTEAKDGTELLFTADRYFVVGAETITPRLSLRRNGKPVPYTVTQAFVGVLDPHAGPDAPRYPFTLDTPFAPSAIPNLARQTALGLYLEIAFAGVTQRTRIDFQYTPAAGIPARFTGHFADHVTGGSLVIAARVAVAQPGRYLVDCNLYDEADRPIAWTRAKIDLAAGTHDVPLQFFGKVLVDQRASGRFHIGQLRGARYVADRDPDLEQMPFFEGTYTTRAYAADEWSAAEYDSAHKREMIQMLTEQQQRGVHQGPAGR